MERTIVHPLIALLFATAIQAQNSYLYEVSQPGVDSYIDLTGDTPVNIFDEDGWHAVTDAPMVPVWCFGTPYEAGTGGYFAINRNGAVRFGNTELFSEIDIARTPMEPTDPGSGVSYRYYEGPGGGALVVQFKNMRLLNGINGNFMNAQLWYHLNSGLIKMHYGPRSSSNGSGFFGDRGPHIGLYHTPVDLSGCLERIWLSGDPAGPQVDYNASYEFGTLNGLPAAGTVFRFIPMFSIQAGLIESEASPFRMQSNLVTDKLTVRMAEPSGTTLLIIDARGRVVQRFSAQGGSNTVDISGLANGFYTIAGASGGGSNATRFLKG